MLQLLDLAGIYFRAFFAVPSSITAPDGTPNNAIRGSLEIIRKVVEDGQPERILACLDLDWRPAFRVAAIPSYKTHRVLGPPVVAVPQTSGALMPGGLVPEVVPEDLSPQVPVLLEILTAMGIGLAGAPGFEADDVIGTLAARRDGEVEVVTGDRDLFQVATDDPPWVRVRYIGAGMSKAEVLGAQQVSTKYGIPVGRYADFAALRGDPSDGLPGVPGVGDKTAAAMINQFGGLAELAAAVADPRSALTAAHRRKLEPAADYLRVAMVVVQVAVDAPVTVDPAGDHLLPLEAVDPTRLAELVAEYGVEGPVSRLYETIRSLR